MIPRIVTSRIEEALDSQAAVVLTGPRQVGKTTLALEIGERRSAVYLDLESTRDLASIADPVPFLESVEDRLVILDEIHRVPSLFPTLRGIIDRGRRMGKGTGRFLILGSASIDLTRQAGESLAGRVEYIDLTPLTLPEVSGLSGPDRLWLRGGFPGSYLASSEERSVRFRVSMIRTYLERDIPLFGPRVPVEAMERLWTMLAYRQGSILNVSDLAQAMETSARSIGRYFDLLVDLLLVRRLRPYLANIGKRLVKSPKVYIRDSGIMHALLGIDDLPELLGNPIVGLGLEGFVLENLLSVMPWRSHAFFYRTQVGAEIDLVIEHGDGALWAIEIKRSLAAPLSRGFHIARDDIGAARSFVIHAGDDRFPIAQGVEAISVPDLMRELATSP